MLSNNSSVHESCQHFTGHSVRQSMKVCLTDKIFVLPKNKVRGLEKSSRAAGVGAGGFFIINFL